MNLVIVTSNKLYFHSLHKRFKCAANEHRELHFCHKFYPFIQFWECIGCSIGSSILMLVSQIFELASNCLVYSNHQHTHSIWMFVAEISISSFFIFWKLDYFSDMNYLKNPLSDMISCSSSTQLITSDFSLWY